ncbi:glycosyltransferase [Xanthobacter autotrophicus]|uniref:glycosyltransferase n=1 Tax=Xanthobacter autotrophicus TaxID=280 RepID=UPI003726E4A3
MRARRVLMAWEQGAGFGHTTQLARLGRRLMAEGVEVAAAVRYLQLSAPLAEAGIRVMQSPIWPPPVQRPDDTRPASATLCDSLGRAGLRDTASVRTALRGWRVILDAEQPDLMVCDYAPLAAPAARGRCAIMQVGTAYCLPPSDLEEMPALHDFAPPLHHDRDLLASVNAALADEGMAPLERIGALFAGDDVFVRTFPLIDPYADLRDRQAEGPILGEKIGPARSDARGIFAYLHPQVAGRPDVMEALRALGPQLEIYVPGAEPGLMEPLRTAGARVHARPAPMAEVLARSRLVLHQGSAGVATEALLAGVPQVTLCVHGEHYLNGECLAAAGLGLNLPLFDPRVRVAAETIRTMHEDEDVHLMAEAAGRMHRAMLAEDPLDVLTRRCLALL